MTSLSEAKTLGGIGSILVLLTAAPTVGWILGIVGFIMILVAVKSISDAVKEERIFNNMLISVVLAIGGIAVGTIALVGTLFQFIGMGTFVGPDFVPAQNVPVGNWMALAGAAIIGLVAVWAFSLASAVFVRRSYSAIASKLNVKTFGTAGLLYLIGAATMVIGIGFILIFVAEILLAIAFFSIPERLPEAPQAQSVAVHA
jgi:uncharacterized membrane protein